VATVTGSSPHGASAACGNIANARIGVATDKWDAALFVDNLTNKVAELSANNTQFQFNVPQIIRFSTNQPRTFGTQINYHF